MVNVKSKKCAHEGCKTIPSYNYEGKTKRSFCSVHKEDGLECVEEARQVAETTKGTRVRCYSFSLNPFALILSPDTRNDARQGRQEPQRVTSFQTSSCYAWVDVSRVFIVSHFIRPLYGRQN
jgi:hypothetical protein